MMTSLWPQLLSTALVGTQRRAPDTVAVPEQLNALVPVLRSEADLLSAAGSLTLARRAGVGVVTGVQPLAPAPVDDLPLAPAAARRRLRLLIGTSVDPNLVELWLTLAVERGVGVAGRDLPNLFRIGRAHERLRDAITTVAGARGAWLAAMNGEWSWVVDRRAVMIDVDDEQAWTEGSLADRVAYLATARRRDPARGRELLEAVWAKEPSPERAALLPTLSAGLGLDDEPFLDAALDDRRKEVRIAAQALLATLPGSAYERRMADRARATVAASGRKLVVTPPDSCDNAMKRDGVEPKPPHGIGERAWWFEQIVSAAPLSTWESFGAAPAELAAGKVVDDWAPSLHRAWANAAVRAGDTVWAAALLSAGFGSGVKAKVVDAELTTALHRMLPADEAIATALTRLAAVGTTVAQAAAIVDICPRPWTEPLAAALLGFLGKQMRVTNTAYLPYHLGELATAIVVGLRPDAYASVAALARDLAGTNIHGLAETLVTLAETRYQILQEFA